MDHMLDTGVILLDVQHHDAGLRGSLKINPSCPLFAGHFPEHHILPAVGQVKIIVALCRRLLGEQLVIRNIPRAKFIQPVEPGAILSFQIGMNDHKSEIKWSLGRGQNEVSRGLLHIEPMSSEQRPRDRSRAQ